MINRDSYNRNEIAILNPSEQLSISRFYARTYGWMAVGLLITTFVSFAVCQSESAIQFIFGNRWVFYCLLFGELGLVSVLSVIQRRLSPEAALAGFLAYSGLNGLTLGVIFLAYTLESVFQIFMVSSAMFAGLAVFGAVTRKDLSAIGTFFAMGLWGMIILGFANVFMGSESLSMGLGAAGVLVFSGLTAWESQKVRLLALEHASGSTDSAEERKAAIYGALSMYLNFINLFLSFLRLFGKRRG